MKAVPVYKLKVVFSRKDESVLLSQLDLQRFYIRALRRADLPVRYSQGFSPHPRISYYGALKLGDEGELIVVFAFNEKIQPDDFKEKFSKELPVGMTVLSVEEVDDVAKE